MVRRGAEMGTGSKKVHESGSKEDELAAWNLYEGWTYLEDMFI